MKSLCSVIKKTAVHFSTFSYSLKRHSCQVSSGIRIHVNLWCSITKSVYELSSKDTEISGLKVNMQTSHWVKSK